MQKDSAVMADFNEFHPELKVGEFWLRNVRESNYPLEVAAGEQRGQVVRMGTTAYGPDGKALQDLGPGMDAFRPIFLTGLMRDLLDIEVLHPECNFGEACIGNFTLAGFQSLGYALKRMGRTAYDARGARLPVSGDENVDLFPVFVNVAEYVKRQG